ncbi:hypothetical protein FDA77_18995 [Clostridium botulinum]|uniref:hypothetical protein n=1 Tax=Clostridium botulinum TaxID=1491 RepID=UPI0013FAD9A5|nr:hypothetical protein [Clostridium botulinum]MBY6888749.1 hypothetical protein [Clostridium botulinum]NFI47909.1 hypothetical protein [Clostridium botulinum]NFJ91916.1 hypothetical protein [Clostridium botulinum]NFO72185.1 hypothetical protein [Clostridium botulinum]HBJ2609737.1 hypothetical protein [Clostridium botulinum]
MEFEIQEKDYELLKKIGIDVFPEDRNYWFIRTQSGTYYDSFVNEGFVGIEWDEISDLKLIKNSNEEKLKLDVIKYYPKVEKPGHPVNQILRFANDIKKGDIVLIPNERSEWICIGEFLSDEMYIYEEEEDFQDILDSLDDDCKDKKPILKKRRKVRWIKQVKRNELDPYLYRIIYSHNAVCDANKYSIFIDRTLSQFYIKGNEAYYTYKVNKKRNIPYIDMLSFLNNNNNIINYINAYYSDLSINADDLILKISVQSKGPIQLKGAIRNVLIIGLIMGSLFGGKLNLKIPGFEYNVETEGLPKLLNSIQVFLEKRDSAKIDKEEKEKLEKIIEQLQKDKKKLELQLPLEEDIENNQDQYEYLISEK